MRPLRSITFVYDLQQDRILAVINVGQVDNWACWLTRRMVLAALQQVRDLVERTSELAKNAGAEFRSDLIAFEREAALANTSGAVTQTPNESLKSSASTTERAHRLTVTYLGQQFRLELEGMSGEMVQGLIARPVFQRIIRSLEDEVDKAEWLLTPMQGNSNPMLARAPIRH
jgi:hypothetical protein